MRVSGVLRIEIRGDQIFIYNPTASRGADGMLATEKIFRAVMRPAPVAEQQFRHRAWSRPWLRSHGRAEYGRGGTAASRPENPLAGRALDIVAEFLAAKARAEKRNKLWAAAFIILTFIIAVAFYAHGNVIAGCAFLSLPVCGLIGKFLVGG